MIASLALSILTAAVMPGSPLSMPQVDRLARVLVCPERLRDDAARLRNTEQYIALYASFDPQSRMGERMEVRRRLLAAKKCDAQRDALQYTFPEI